MEALTETPEGTSATQQRTRSRILGAAADHFARFGYRRTNIADIADEAGIGKGTVYLYFDNKIELLAACVAQEKLELIPQLEQAMSRPPSERLEAYLQIAIRFVITAPLSGALIRGDRELSAAMADAAEEGLLTDPGQGISLVAELVADAAPGLADEERDRLAQVLLAVSSLPAHLPALEFLVDLSAEEFTASYARVLALGVASHSPSRTETP
jgi:AcrR family transcriptional regulator